MPPAKPAVERMNVSEDEKMLDAAADRSVTRSTTLQPLIKQLLILSAVVGVAILATGCQFLLPPGPISVDVDVSPSTVASGSSIQLTISVQNSGGTVTIDEVTMHEVATSGWAVGSYDYETTLPISNYQIDPRSSATILNQSIPVYNTGYNNVTFELEISVISDGGSDEDSATYTVRNW